MSLNKKHKVVLAVLILLVFQVKAQAVPPPIPPPPPPGLPVDGGIVFLLLGGLFYGVKKIISKS